MRSISEHDLCVFIQLLAAKIGALQGELRSTDGRQDELSDAEFDARTDTQDMVAAYQRTLQAMRDEHEAALAEGTRLPSFEQLTALHLAGP